MKNRFINFNLKNVFVDTSNNYKISFLEDIDINN